MRKLSPEDRRQHHLESDRKYQRKKYPLTKDKRNLERREYFRNYQKQRRLKKHDEIKNYQKQWHIQNPEKVKAEILAHQIKIPKGQLCEECGKTLAVHRHHPKYSNPLEIKFLCYSCHRKKRKAELR